MSIASEITRLQTSKADIKTQVNIDVDDINEGTDFIDEETLDDYADLIKNMQDAYKQYIPIHTKMIAKGNTTQNGTPTPSSPVLVNNVTGEQVVRVCGKNLYNPSYRTSSNNIFVGNGTATEENGTFTLTATNTDLYMWQVASAGNPYNKNTNGKLYNFIEDEYTITITNQLMVANYITFFDENFVSLGFIGFGGVGYKKTFKRSDSNVPSDAKYFSIRIGYNQAVAGETYTFSVQLEVGTSSTTYEPYQGKDYEINLGKNLFDKDKATTGGRLSNVNGTIYAESGYFYSNFIKVEPSTSYTKNSAIADAYHRVCFYSSASESGYISKSESNVFTTPNDCEYIRFCGIDTEINTTQLEKGTTPTTYAPYFTPIELNKIGNYQDYIRKGTGKNLFDKNNANILNGWLDNNKMALSSTQLNKLFYIPCKANTTYTISRSILTSTFRVATYNSEPFPTIGSSEAQYDISGLIKDNSATSITITTGANAKYLIVHYGRLETDLNIEESLKTIQIEENSQATSYEPYGYKDKWYIERNVGKVVLNGSESGWSYPSANRFNLDDYVNDYLKKNNDVTYVCDSYIGYGQKPANSDFNTLVANVNYGFDFGSGNAFNIRIKDTRYTSIADFKSSLQTNNVTIYYIFVNPTYTLIENEELIEQLDAVQLQTGENNVLVSGDLPMILDLSKYIQIAENHL